MDKKEEVKLTIKPKYNVVFSFLYNHVTTLLIIILILVVLISENQLIEYGIAILVIYVIYLIINAIYNKVKYRNSFYKFYSDKLVYNNKIKDDDEKEVKYTEMTQIKYGQTFLQTVFKIGTIMIYTNNKKITQRIIFINGVKDVKLVYEKILKVIGEKTTDNK
jgi:membrane protein YdbS with pleckstrin-like domain